MAAVLVSSLASSPERAAPRADFPLPPSSQPATVLTSRVDGTGPPDNDSSAKRNRVLSLVRKSDGVLIPSSLEYS